MYNDTSFEEYKRIPGSAKAQRNNGLFSDKTPSKRATDFTPSVNKKHNLTNNLSGYSSTQDGTLLMQNKSRTGSAKNTRARSAATFGTMNRTTGHDESVPSSHLSPKNVKIVS